MKQPDIIRQHLIQSIDKFNQYWQQKNFEALAALLDEQVVFVSPGFQQAITGIEACVATFTQFSEKAIVEFFEMDPPQINLIRNTAVTTYTFHIRYLLNRQSFEETGTDILVWQKKDWNTWLIIWRGMADLRKR